MRKRIAVRQRPTSCNQRCMSTPDCGGALFKAPTCWRVHKLRLSLPAHPSAKALPIPDGQLRSPARQVRGGPARPSEVLESLFDALIIAQSHAKRESPICLHRDLSLAVPHPCVAPLLQHPERGPTPSVGQQTLEEVFPPNSLARLERHQPSRRSSSLSLAQPMMSWVVRSESSSDSGYGVALPVAGAALSDVRMIVVPTVDWLRSGRRDIVAKDQQLVGVAPNVSERSTFGDGRGQLHADRALSGDPAEVWHPRKFRLWTPWKSRFRQTLVLPHWRMMRYQMTCSSGV